MWIKDMLRKHKQLFKFLKSTKKGLKTLWSINLCRTLYVNFKTQKFSDAIKFPIYIYGRLKICKLSGNLTIAAHIKQGMIKFGYNVDKFSADKGGAVLIVNGDLVLEGAVIFNADNVIVVNGICLVGALTNFGYGVRIRCNDKISFGCSCRIAIETQILDTNFHFTRDIQTGKIYNRQSPIEIGDFCWVGNRTSIMKGTKLPHYSVVGGGSLLNKDYTKDAPVAPLLAGMPARILGSGSVRVFSQCKEDEIGAFFDQNPQASFYQAETKLTNVEQEMKDIAEYFDSL